MSPNTIRGEVTLCAGGKSYRLLLTLGALAEIESGLGLSDLSEVSARLKTLRAADLAVVAASLMRGGGHDVSPADVMRLPCDLGALVQAVAEAFEAAGLRRAEAALASAKPERLRSGAAGSAAQAGLAREEEGAGEASAPFAGRPGSNSASA